MTTVPSERQPAQGPGVDDHEVVIFQIGHKTLAVRLNQVEHILSLGGADGVPISEDGGAILFQNEAIAWHPLWQALGEESLYAEFDRLISTLPQRRQDHIDWMAALEQSLLHEEIPFTKARSPFECAFGKWFYAFKSEDRRLSMLLSQFEAPHARIHSLADRLLGLAAVGQREQALVLFEEERRQTLDLLLQLFDQVLNLLPMLKRPVALIVNPGDGRRALGIDRVMDIRQVGAEGLRPASRRRLGGLAPTAFVLSADGQGALVPLVDVDQLLFL